MPNGWNFLKLLRHLTHQDIYLVMRQQAAIKRNSTEGTVRKLSVAVVYTYNPSIWEAEAQQSVPAWWLRQDKED